MEEPGLFRRISAPICDIYATTKSTLKDGINTIKSGYNRTRRTVTGGRRLRRAKVQAVNRLTRKQLRRSRR
jgi:hypothetical protein